MNRVQGAWHVMLNTLWYVLFSLYAISLPVSMAGMELFAWLCFLSTLGACLFLKYKGESFPHISIPGNKFLWAFWFIIVIEALFLDGLNQEDRIYIIGEGRWILLLYCFVFLWSLSLPRFEKALPWALILLGVVCLYSITQTFTGIDFARSGELGKHHTVGAFFRGRGFYHSTMTYSYAFGMIFCFGLGLQLYGYFRRPIKKYMLWGVNILMGMSLILTFTRGLWIALIVSVGFMIWQFNRKLLVAFSLIGVVGGIGVYYGSKTFKSRVASISDLSDDSNNGRLQVWSANLEMIKDRPLQGVGYRMNSKFLDEYYAKLGIVDGFKGHAHNNYLQIFAGTGVFGFIAYMGFCICFFIIAWRLWIGGQGALEKSVGLGSMGAQICLHIGGLTQVNFTDGEVNHVFIFLMSLTIALYNLKVSKKGAGIPA